MDITLVELGEYFSGQSSLRCPACGSDYLHQGSVMVFRRDEDEETTSVTDVLGRATIAGRMASATSGNPSARREGIVISFECEGCNAHPQLAIAQHKGIELISWRLPD